MVYCCVPLCKNEDSKGIGVSFHKFPTNEDLREKWLKVISRQGPEKNSIWQPSKKSVVCSQHFDYSCFSISTTNRRLLPNSVPTIFPGYPSYKQTKTENPHRKRNYQKAFFESHGSSGSLPLPAPEGTIAPAVDIANSVSTEVEAGVQVDMPCKSSRSTNRNAGKYYSRAIARKNKTIARLRAENIVLRAKLQTRNKKSEADKLYRSLVSASEAKNMKAIFLLEQLKAFGKNKVQYSEEIIKISVLWQKKSPKGYAFAREMEILQLPHKSTLRKYLGGSSGQTGITEDIRQRLKTEIELLSNELEKVGSLIIDEMSIQAKLTYDRQLDQYHGKDELNDKAPQDGEKLANSLLCFVFRGLATKYRIPVAFFFCSNLNGFQLHEKTLQVIAAVEEVGFRVLRIVTDNSKVNVAMFEKMCGGTVKPEISHPFDENRNLFLSYDQSHIIKNVRSQFLDRTLRIEGREVSGRHVRTLYRLQSNLVFKPVRNLTRKMVYPSNLEKMNVKRAKLLFSESITAALETCASVASEYFPDKESLQATVDFMKIIKKWYDIHDICNTTHAYTSRNYDKLHFFSVSDERLLWLTETFLPYMKKIQESGRSRQEAFSLETYNAIVITTESTVACVQYLLKVGFHYVLTRNFSSDDIELFFSHLRQLGGFNDMMDARSCMHAIETTVKTGLLRASMHANVETTTITTTNSEKMLPTAASSACTSEVQLPDSVLEILNRPLSSK